MRKLEGRFNLDLSNEFISQLIGTLVLDLIFFCSFGKRDDHLRSA